jgi:hypothetical protein
MLSSEFGFSFLVAFKSFGGLSLHPLKLHV